MSEWIDPVEHSRFFSQDFGVLDEILPFDRVKLLEIFEKSDPRIVVLLTNDLSEGEQRLKGRQASGPNIQL
jgi:hypothetical protein